MKPRKREVNKRFRPHHERFIILNRLSEPQREVRDGLRAALHAYRLVICERMVLRRHPSMVDDRPSVGGEPGHGATDVRIDLHDLLDRGGLEELGRDALLDAENDTVGGSDADGRRAELMVGKGRTGKRAKEWRGSGALSRRARRQGNERDI